MKAKVIALALILLSMIGSLIYVKLIAKPKLEERQDVVAPAPLTENNGVGTVINPADRRAARGREIAAAMATARPSEVARMYADEFSRRQEEDYQAATKRWNQTHPDGKPKGPGDFGPMDHKTPFFLN